MSKDPNLSWRRSSRCGSSACVEVAITSDAVYVRKSQDPGGPRLCLAARDWRVFVEGLRAGAFGPDQA